MGFEITGVDIPIGLRDNMASEIARPLVLCPKVTHPPYDNLDLYKSTASMLTTSQYSEQQRSRFAVKIKQTGPYRCHMNLASSVPKPLPLRGRPPWQPHALRASFALPL